MLLLFVYSSAKRNLIGAMSGHCAPWGCTAWPIGVIEPESGKAGEPCTALDCVESRGCACIIHPRQPLTHLKSHKFGQESKKHSKPEKRRIQWRTSCQLCPRWQVTRVVCGLLVLSPRYWPVPPVPRAFTNQMQRSSRQLQLLLPL